MPRPLLIFSQSDYLILIVTIFVYLMANSADPVQLASDLDLNCFQGQSIFGFSMTRVDKSS